MKPPVRRLASLCAGLGLLTALASCVADVGYGGDYGVRGYGGYSPGFVEPYGYDYGRWGGDYRVGPGRGGDRRSTGESHAFHSAPHSRPTPSIPRGARGRDNRQHH